MASVVNTVGAGVPTRTKTKAETHDADAATSTPKTAVPSLSETKKAGLEASLSEWYKMDPRRAEKLESVVSGKADFSLREIDWFVTNYSVRNPVVYTLPTGKVVDVNMDYKDALKSFHKAGFDAFKRKGTDPREAPLRQMNFFRWAIENGVVDYVTRHAKVIERDMLAMRGTKSSAKRPAPSCPPEECPPLCPDMTGVSLPSATKKQRHRLGVCISASEQDLSVKLPRGLGVEW